MSKKQENKTPEITFKLSMKAGIMNVIGLALSIAFFVIMILCIQYAGVFEGSSSSEEALGLMFLIILIFPIVLIAMMIAYGMSGILNIFLAIWYFITMKTKNRQVRKTPKGLFVFAIVWRVIALIVGILGLLFFDIMLNDLHQRMWAVIFTLLGLAVLVYELVLTKVEKAERKAKNDEIANPTPIPEETVATEEISDAEEITE